MGMRWFLFYSGCVATGFLFGCAALDGFFGIDPASGDFDTTGSIGDSAGGLASSFIPWLGAGITTLGGLYAHLRGRRYSSALASVVRGVHAVRANKAENGSIKLTEAELMRIFSAIQDADGTREEVRKKVAAVEKG